MAENDFEGVVTADIGGSGFEANSIEGGAASGGVGQADLILWGVGKDAGTIRVWEVKADTDTARAGWDTQLGRYIDGLQVMFPEADVAAGPFVGRRPYTSKGGTGSVWSRIKPDGLRLYGRNKDERVPLPLGRFTRPEFYARAATAMPEMQGQRPKTSARAVSGVGPLLVLETLLAGFDVAFGDGSMYCSSPLSTGYGCQSYMPPS